MYARLMLDWRLASEKEPTADGRIAVAVLASFVEGMSTTASLAAPGTLNMCISLETMLADRARKVSKCKCLPPACESVRLTSNGVQVRARTNHAARCGALVRVRARLQSQLFFPLIFEK